jgi:glyoxylase-like metal-dependent hydrolase (beta-lactamase superfamily II)
VLIDMGAGRLVQSLHEAGIEPGQIDTVIITHGHPDHIGRALDSEGQPMYANAQHSISKAEWDFWMADDPPPEAPGWFVELARKRFDGLRDRITFLEGESEIVPGVRAIPAPGHTPGHMIVAIPSGYDQVLYVGDAATHMLHLEYPDWHTSADVAPDQALATKRWVFDQAAADGALVVGTHFAPFPSLGTVVKQGEGWQWLPVDIKDPG